MRVALHLDILKWARKNGCSWNEKTCYKAARYGHLSVLQWARENHYWWDLKTSYKASKGGRPSAVRSASFRCSTMGY
jgi:hypothetical protein